MEQLVEFIGNHPILIIAFVALVAAIIVTEVRRLTSGASSLEPAVATQLYNRQNGVFVDIRGEAEYRKAHLPAAINVPAANIEGGLSKLSRYKDRPVIVYCDNGMQSGRICNRLRKEGFEQVHQLQGGLAAWRNASFPLEGK